MKSKPRCVGELDPLKHAPSSVRDEVRRNLIRKLHSGDPLFPGIIGFDDSVLPQVVNALLARHDIIFLGLRGQAKTRLCRLLVNFLDDEVPAIEGSVLREHPLGPITSHCRARARAEGPELPIEWIPREARYGEKLATPDVTMADLLGDIDPLKAAHRKLDLGSEEVIHFGIIPRMNRGVFAVNELPDLAPRIQVGLLNILEERDVQIRGFPVRIPLDVLMVFTANPEDYTNRGSIITPLKDRIASQILTHYPRTIEAARSISDAQSWCNRGESAPRVEIPAFMLEILEQIAFRGRESEYVDQKSGVSARLPIAARELLVSQVERRVLRNPGAKPVPRIVDLCQVAAAVTGKVELVYEGEQEGSIKVTRHLIGQACRAVFDQHFPDALREAPEEKHRNGPRTPRRQHEPRVQSARYKPILDWFAAGNRIDISDDLDDEAYIAALEAIPGLLQVATEFLPGDARESRAPVMELILEGLHQHSLLAKEDLIARSAYSDMLGVMLEDLK
ncbi:MAG TPA: magnesium chelatase [Planctomycetota bacterium]|nr:magnesium chelatase [Planctomycetota bacterium]